MKGGLHGFTRERDKEEERGNRDRREERGNRDRREERETNFFLSLKFNFF